MAEIINLHQSLERLRSNANDHLQLHRTVFRTKNYGGRAFSSCAPGTDSLWMCGEPHQLRL